MTRNICGQGDVAIHFEESDVVITPFTVDIYKNEGQFDHLRAKLSIEAGNLIDEKVSAREPATLWSENVVIGRFMVPNDGLDLGTDEAFLKLFDELQIADFVEINKQFTGRWKVIDIIDYIFQEIKEEDEFDILTDWSQTETNIDKLVGRTVSGTISRNADPRQDLLFDRLLNRTVENLAGKIRNRYSFLEDNADFVFEEESALNALNKIAKHFAIDIFTKNDGVMYVGYNDDDIDTYVASFTPESYNLTNYTVGAGQNKIKGVLMEGESVTDLTAVQTSNPIDNIWNVFTGQQDYQMYGVALRNDIEDGRIVTISTDARQPDSLRQQAENHLVQEVSENQAGHCDVDFLSSDINELLDNDMDDIRQSTIGDIFIVGEHGGQCQNIKSGLYRIDSIHHEINPRNGWMVRLGIKQTFTGNIGTGAFGWDHRNREVVEDFNMLTLGLRYDDGRIGSGIPGYAFEPIDGDIDGSLAFEVFSE